MIKVLIVDDHPLFRKGIRFYLESSSEIELVGELDTGEEVISFIEGNKVDVVLMDLKMPGLSGVEVTEQILARWEDTKVLVLTSFGGWDKVYSALQAGAAGYLLKDAQPEALRAAIKAVAAGGTYFEEDVAAQLLNKVQVKNQPKELIEPLTERELEVLRLIAEGLGNQEIADELVISKNTVKTHITNIFQKLQVDSRTEAALYTVRQGLI